MDQLVYRIGVFRIFANPCRLPRYNGYRDTFFASVYHGFRIFFRVLRAYRYGRLELLGTEPIHGRRAGNMVEKTARGFGCRFHIRDHFRIRYHIGMDGDWRDSCVKLGKVDGKRQKC